MSRNETTFSGAINAVNDIVSEQSVLIGRIRRALDGKSGQSSGAAGATYVYQSVPDAVHNFLEQVTYDENDTTTSLVESYFDGAMRDKPVGKSVSTEQGTIEVSDISGRRTEIASNGSYVICDIAPPYGTAVNISDGDIVKAYKLCPSDSLRMINTPYAHNVRDVGGWRCDGGTVKYGMMYRGGQPNESDIPVLVDYLGIRHQFNLRGREESEEEGVANGALGIRHHLYDSFAWYSLSDSALWTEMLTDIFEAVSYGEPLYFHCSAGADRTGTMAFVLMGLLGVSRSDLDKDYELTSFYSAFVTHKPSSRTRTKSLQSLITSTKSFSGTNTRDRLITFVKSLGFTSDQINAYRAAMINGNPEVIA